ncbi:MAG: polysaccharide biosynthesis tyrosine autokinase [Planctomycetes bacterium]|nr:polysaccharide biosynthesis tyrosine autokinase [Planctomycetota bacterium]
MRNEPDRDFIPPRARLEQEVHLADYLSIIWKRKWIAIIFFLVVVSVVSVKTYHTKPVYVATAKVRISGISSPVKGMTQISGQTGGRIETQCNLLQSRELARRVAEELKLEKYCNDNREKPNFFASLIGNFKGLIYKIATPANSKTPVAPKRTDSENSVKGEDVLLKQQRIVGWYLSRLKVSQIPDTNLVNISFSERSPEMAARVANSHVKTYIEKNRQLESTASQTTFDWLKNQLRDQKTKLANSALAMDEFKYRELDFHPVDSDSFFELSEIKNHYVIQDLRRQLVQLKANKMELNTKYGPKHPKIVEINASIEQLEKSIVDEVVRLKESMRTELDRAVVEVGTETKNMTKSDLQSEFHDGKFANYGMLELEAESDKTIYDILLNQAKEIDLTGNMESDNINIIDAAVIPRRPIKPNVIFNITLAAVMGLAFGIGFAFFTEYMDKTVKTPEDIVQRIELPVLGVLPYNKYLKRSESLVLPTNGSRNRLSGSQLKLEDPRLDVENGGQYDVSDNLNATMCGLPLLQSGVSGQVFLVESATAGEGKTTVLANSAINLSRGGLRVAMVDADIQRPSLHKKFGLKEGNAKGLLNVMTRILSKDLAQGTLDDCSIDDLFFLVSLKKQSGKLVVKDDSQTMTAAFENGRLIHIQSHEVPFANRLGTMLLRGGFIDEKQLKDSLDRNERTGLPMGYILINSGYINQSQLQGPLKLQMEEHLQKLFSWKQGGYVFEPGHVDTCEDRRIHFREDYVPIIKRLGRTVGSRLVEREILSYIESIEGLSLSLLTSGRDVLRHEGPQYFSFLAKVLDILKQRYDLVLVDAPPVLEALGSVRPLLPLADGVIFVVKSGQASIKMVDEAATLLKESGTRIVGTILNQAKNDTAYYKY